MSNSVSTNEVVRAWRIAASSNAGAVGSVAVGSKVVGTGVERGGEGGGGEVVRAERIVSSLGGGGGEPSTEPSPEDSLRGVSNQSKDPQNVSRTPPVNSRSSLVPKDDESPSNPYLNHRPQTLLPMQKREPNIVRDLAR